MRVHPCEVALVAESEEQAGNVVATPSYRALRAELSAGNKATQKLRDALRAQYDRQAHQLVHLLNQRRKS